MGVAGRDESSELVYEPSEHDLSVTLDITNAEVYAKAEAPREVVEAFMAAMFAPPDSEAK